MQKRLAISAAIKKPSCEISKTKPFLEILTNDERGSINLKHKKANKSTKKSTTFQNTELSVVPEKRKIE